MPPMMPCRRKQTSSTKTSPSTSFQAAPSLRVACRKSCRKSHTPAPTSGPNNVPRPPMAVCMMSWPEVSNMKASGGMKPCSTPSRPPAKPA